MARAHRAFESGGFYHVTAHGLDERPLFRDNADRSALVATIGHSVRVYRLRCYAVCLMTTHFHFLVGLREPNLAEAMRLVNGSYARHFKNATSGVALSLSRGMARSR